MTEQVCKRNFLVLRVASETFPLVYIEYTATY